MERRIEKRMLKLGAALAAGTAGGLLRSHYERDHFVVEETAVRSPKIRCPRTLVFLADLHDKEFGEGNRRLLAAVREAHPDLVLIGGDTMVAKKGRAGLAVTEGLLKGLAGLCPVIYGNGNHEQRLLRKKEEYGTLYGDFLRLLERYGVIYLADSSVELDEDLRISGLDIRRSFYRKFCPARMEDSYITRRLGDADPKRFQILLAHSPLFWDAYAAWGADLTLAGHFHGGTIRLPFLGGVMTPQYQFFLPVCAGVFQKKDRYMIVSRGLGTHSINIRIFNKPQVVVVKLLPGRRRRGRTVRRKSGETQRRSGGTQKRGRETQKRGGEAQ